MFLKYEKQNCVHCDREFAKNDDVVVCPVCGTPHHRECWAHAGGCGNESLHAQGFVYKNPNQPQNSEKTEKCSFCGNENPTNALLCHKCGADLTNGGQDKTTPNGMGNIDGMPFMTFNFAPPKNSYEDSKETIDDVPVSTIAKRVMAKTEYYIPQFTKLSKRKIPISWNWAAFIMPTCVWFYYRKCYLAGTLAAIFDILVQILFNGFFTECSKLMLSEMPRAEFLAAFGDLFFTPTGFALLGILIGFKILMGLSGNALYKSQVMSDIKNNKESMGGTSLIAPVLGYFLFNNIAMILISLFG